MSPTNSLLGARKFTCPLLKKHKEYVVKASVGLYDDNASVGVGPLSHSTQMFNELKTTSELE
jgi:hypothetical protein